MSGGLVLAVAGAGAVGALLRFGAERLHARRRSLSPQGDSPRWTFPWATLAVNVAGSFLLGWVAGSAAAGHLDPTLALVLGVGVAGALTTYSTFSLDLLLLVRSEAFRAAAVYVAASLVLGIGAAVVGYSLR